MGPMGLDKAKKEYESKMHDKSVKGDYRVLDINYDKEDGSAEEKLDNMKKDSSSSKLARPIAEFINLIFDTNMMNN